MFDLKLEYWRSVLSYDECSAQGQDCMLQGPYHFAARYPAVGQQASIFWKVWMRL